MGVIRLTSWLVRHYAFTIVHSLRAALPYQFSPNHPVMNPTRRFPLAAISPIDNLYIDFNLLLHLCAPETPQKFPQDASAEDLFHIFFRNLETVLDAIMSAAQPRALLYIALDGVPPLAKLMQQRPSRLELAVESPFPNYPLHHVLFTPGTPTMARVNQWLREFISTRKKSHPLWASLRVVLSDATVAGEGEHKIAAFIRAHYPARNQIVTRLSEFVKEAVPVATLQNNIDWSTLALDPVTTTFIEPSMNEANLKHEVQIQKSQKPILVDPPHIATSLNMSSHCIFSMDSDTILSSLISGQPFIYLMRFSRGFEPMFESLLPSFPTQIDLNFSFIDVAHLRTAIVKEMRPSCVPIPPNDTLVLPRQNITTPIASCLATASMTRSPTFATLVNFSNRENWSSARCLDDWVALTGFLGSDFIPMMISNSSGAFERLVTLWREFLLYSSQHLKPQNNTSNTMTSPSVPNTTILSKDQPYLKTSKQVKPHGQKKHVKTKKIAQREAKQQAKQQQQAAQHPESPSSSPSSSPSLSPSSQSPNQASSPPSSTSTIHLTSRHELLLNRFHSFFQWLLQHGGETFARLHMNESYAQCCPLSPTIQTSANGWKSEVVFLRDTVPHAHQIYAHHFQVTVPFQPQQQQARAKPLTSLTSLTSLSSSSSSSLSSSSSSLSSLSSSAWQGTTTTMRTVATTEPYHKVHQYYLTALRWVTAYHHGYCPSQLWYFPYLMPPLLSLLAVIPWECMCYDSSSSTYPQLLYLPDNNQSKEMLKQLRHLSSLHLYGVGCPIVPIQQLVMVIPPIFLNLLPPELCDPLTHKLGPNIHRFTIHYNSPQLIKSITRSGIRFNSTSYPVVTTQKQQLPNDCDDNNNNNNNDNNSSNILNVLLASFAVSRQMIYTQQWVSPPDVTRRWIQQCLQQNEDIAVQTQTQTQTTKNTTQVANQWVLQAPSLRQSQHWMVATTQCDVFE